MSFRFGRFRSGIVGAALFQFAVPVPVTKWVGVHNSAFFLWFASSKFGTIGNRFEATVVATKKWLRYLVAKVGVQFSAGFVH